MMSIIEDLYKDMRRANYNAEQSSVNYNKLSLHLEESERRMCEKLSISEIEIDQRIKSRQDADSKLKSYYNAYKFYVSEVVRISQLLQGMVAYKEIQKYNIINKRYKSST